VDYKSSLNLPKTDFSMKADLARREPEFLRRWSEQSLTQRIAEARRGGARFVLHDGPPYANGHIHYGHILNKILKDLVCKFRTMAGCEVQFKPGWDCHGLPIELAVLRDKGAAAATMSAVEIRRACHEYALSWVRTQGEEFQRLGIFGTWDRPYLTLQPSYEATIVRQLAAFAERGLLYRSKKPVHWCTSDRTALAEAEIEYDEAHVSPSIYVKFAVPAEPGLHLVIWTTTPWTLPANWAIAYHPELSYVTVEVAGGERYVLAAELADKVVAACGLVETAPRQPFAVERFAALGAARHPFLDRDSRLVPADYVTLEQGTGLVHTAPGHGADDYQTGRKFDLPTEAPVDDAGRFDSGPWKGTHVFAANPAIVAFLHERGVLLSPPTLSVTHSYPICWRCKRPVIFRATPQWFARMDADPASDGSGSLRQTALEEIGRTRWIPPWGENRIRGMIENRPDWVLSRQRVWGVPIPVLYDAETREPVASDGAFMRRVADLIAAEGADAWFDRSADTLARLAGLPEGVRVEKGNDIVDVWFESGVSWAAVCEGQEGLDASTPEDPRPVDLYLEGSDQHRGWFHSSLLCAAASRGHAPYRAVLTHGFVLDERGRPYSKSEIEKARREGIKIEFIPPDEVLKTQGAELLRMWVAQADFRNDIAYSRGHLTQLGEAYRKVRNTARFLLGNLFDFDPARDRVATLTDPLDRYLHGRVGELLRRGREAYEAYEFHHVLRALVDFCATDLSALYLDVRKDRLYCDAAGSPARRATQTVLEEALRALALLAAPILCFTAEEIWSHLPKRADDPESVHLALLPDGWELDIVDRTAIEPLLALRAEVQQALEGFRREKRSSQDAHVTLTVPDPGEALRLGQLPAGLLAELFIVSAVTVEAGGTAVVASVADAAGHRCERCRNWTPRADLCLRCQAAVDSAPSSSHQEVQ
jgi:isoleucyl-tRNA synthetase